MLSDRQNMTEHGEPNLAIFQELIQTLESNLSVALATVLLSQGGSPAATGMKLLVHPDGSCLGNIGGGVLEQKVIEDALTSLSENRSQLVNYLLREEGTNAIGTMCGGEVQIFIEVYQPKPTLLIVGGGHVGQSLSSMARELDYQIKLVDIDPDRGQVFEPDDITESTYVVVVTEDAASDEAIVRAALPTPTPYIGMIGSQRKCRKVITRMREDGLEESLFSKIHAPVGLNLGGHQPAQVALAILAEVEMLQHKGSPESKTIIDEELTT